MKQHSTNYYNTFILIAEDSSVSNAEIPPVKETNRTAANIQFEIIRNNPYRYTSDEVLFKVFYEKNTIDEKEKISQRELFFSKGQPCFRASPLTKRYGWGVHYNEEGKMALYPVESSEYQKY